MTTATECPSQLLPEAPFFHGPMASALAEATDPNLTLEMFPATPTQTPAGHDHTEPPSCIWTISSAKEIRSGPLYPLSFIAIWNSQISAIGNIPVDVRLHTPERLSQVPFVTLHPSGFLQAIAYNPTTQQFDRQILYPVASTDPTPSDQDPG